MAQHTFCSSGSLPCYPLPHPPLPNSFSVLLSPVVGRLIPMHCTPSFFVLWLLVGFVQWEVLAGDQRVGGERSWDISPPSLPSWVGCIAGTLLDGGNPPSWGGPCSSSHQPLVTPVPSPGPFSTEKVTALAIAPGKNPSFIKFSSKFQWTCLPFPAVP